MPKTAQREVAYRLTSACCYAPDQLWQETQLFEHLASAIASTAPALAETALALGCAFQQNEQQTLLVDYAALFVGPGPLLAAPYGSVYLEKGRRVMGDSTQSAGEFYRSAGLTFADGFTELPDHIAVELEFCSYLLQRQLAAEGSADADAAGYWQEQRRRFLQQHLGRWVASLCAAVRDNAETTFYQQLADLVEGLVTADLQQLAPPA